MILPKVTVAAKDVITAAGNFLNTNMVGTIGAFGMESPPTGWIICEGQTLNSSSNTEYARLFASIGVTYGGSGAGAFSLPDYRGQFLRSRANGSANDPDRANRTNRGDGTTGDNVGTGQITRKKSLNANHWGARNGGPDANLQLNQGPIFGGGTDWASMTVSHFNGYRHTHNSTAWAFHYIPMYMHGFSGEGTQNAPINKYIMYCIKY
jgi:phage-related tail fiber protein